MSLLGCKALRYLTFMVTVITSDSVIVVDNLMDHNFFQTFSELSHCDPEEPEILQLQERANRLLQKR